jgi:hypothetical protein
MTPWLTFPYDPSLSDGQPAILARVARSNEVLEVIRSTSAGEKVQSASASEQEHAAKVDQLARVLGISAAPATLAVAFHLKEQPHASSNGTAGRHEPERRGSARRVLAVPVRVHPQGIPWFGGRGAMRFRSHREYALGDHLKIAFEDWPSAPWHGDGEFRSKVMRIAPVPSSIALDVSVCRAE